MEWLSHCRILNRVSFNDRLFIKSVKKDTYDDIYIESIKCFDIANNLVYLSYPQTSKSLLIVVKHSLQKHIKLDFGNGLFKL
jgi:hypothetical protein